MTLPTEGTLLILSGMGVPLYSARGLTQTLTPIAAAAVKRRSINGVLYDVSRPQSRKYASKISCTDLRTPAIGGIWPGQTVTVQCVAELNYPVGGSPERPVVSGSEYQDGDFIFYRPVLTMMIVEPPSVQIDEWNADVAWEIDLEEVGAAAVSA